MTAPTLGAVGRPSRRVRLLLGLVALLVVVLRVVSLLVIGAGAVLAAVASVAEDGDRALSSRHGVVPVADAVHALVSHTLGRMGGGARS